MKRISAILLAMILLVSLAVPAFASTALERIEAAKKLHAETNSRLEQLITNSFKRDDPAEAQIIPDDIYPRLPCSQCGGPLKQFDRIFVGEETCERYPLSTGYKDKTYLYRYECNSCGLEEEYINTVCTH